MTGSMAAGMVANKKPGTYTVTPETLAKILKMAEPGATIKLSPGEYGLLKLHGQNAYPVNCTIIGCEGATVDGVSITSGILSSDIIKEGSSDITNAILPRGLAFKEVTFTNCFSLRNARIDNLIVDHCTFEGCNILITPESFKDSYGNDLGAGNSSYYRFPQAHLKQLNLAILNCTFNNAAGYQNEEKTSTGSGIHVIGVENVTVSGNTITGALDEQKNARIFDGIQIGGYNTSPYYVLSHGEIKVTMNTITNCRSRAINVVHINTGNIIVASNKCFNTNTAGQFSEEDINPEAIIVRKSENVTTSWTINGPIGNDFTKGFGNAWEGKKIVVGDGITVSKLTSPSDYYKSLTDIDTKMDAVITSKYTYIGLQDKDEYKLTEWLETTVLPNMQDNTIRNISIRVGGGSGNGVGIIPWQAMGTIHMYTSSYAIIDVITQVHGKRYTKLKNNGVWQPTVCETDKLNAKANKTDVAPAGYGLGENCIYVESLDKITKNGYYRFDTVAGYEMGTCVCHAVVNGNEIHLTGWLSGYILHRTKSGGVWGEWEWETPPMMPNTEYRTTERYEGKPVYAKLVYFGALPNNTFGNVKHNITGSDKIVSCTLSFYNNADTYSAPYFENGTIKAYAQANATYVTVSTTTDYSSYTGVVVLKYTKK